MVNKGLLRKFLDYSVATIINKGLFFLILPILTYYLLPEEYAIYSLLMFFASLVSMFFQFGLQQSLMTLYHSQKTDASRYKLISTTYLSIFLITFLGSICLLGWHQTILKLILNITITSLHKKLYIFTIFYIIFNLFTAVTLILLNIRHDSKQFSYLSLSKNSLLFIFIVVGAITNKLSLNYLFLAMVISAAVSAVFSWYHFQKVMKELGNISRKKLFSIKIFKEIFRFGIYMLPATFAVLILQSSDRYMLNLLSPNKLHDVGIYAAAYKIGMIMSLLTGIFDLVFFPYILKHAQSDRVKIMLRRLFLLYNVAGTAVAALIILFSSEIFLILDPSYRLGGKIVFFSVVSMFLRGIFNLINLGFYILKKSKGIAMGVIIGAAVNIFLNYLLIPKLGMFGAGFASILAYLFIVLFNFIAVQKVFFVEYNLTYFGISLIALSIVAVLNYYPVSWQLVLYKIIFAAFFSTIASALIIRSGKFDKFKEILFRKEN